MKNKELDRIASHFLVCGEALCQGNFTNAAPLRTLQDNLRPVLDSGTDKHLRAVAFMICIWVEKYYFHLSGGFPSRISEGVKKVRHTLLQDNAGPLLKAMGNAIRKPEDVLTIYAELVDVYLRALREVAAIAERSK